MPEGLYCPVIIFFCAVSYESKDLIVLGCYTCHFINNLHICLCVCAHVCDCNQGTICPTMQCNITEDLNVWQHSCGQFLKFCTFKFISGKFQKPLLFAVGYHRNKEQFASMQEMGAQNNSLALPVYVCIIRFKRVIFVANLQFGMKCIICFYLQLDF